MYYLYICTWTNSSDRKKCVHLLFVHLQNSPIFSVCYIVLDIWISILIVKSLENNEHRVADITSFEKELWKFFRSYFGFLSKFGEISFQEYISEGISHPVFYSNLVYKLRRVKGATNFVSSGSIIVKRLRHRKYDPMINERTIYPVLGPSTALNKSFLTYCTLTNKAMGTTFVNDGTCPNLLRRVNALILELVPWLIVGTPSTLWPRFLTDVA